MNDSEARIRAVISGVQPEVDDGRFPIKRTVGDRVIVEADVFADGHDAVSAVLLHRFEDEERWSEVAMRSLVNDRWRGTFAVTRLGHYYYTLEAWVDHFKSWRRSFAKKVDAGEETALDLLVGAQLTEEAAARATGQDRKRLTTWAAELRSARESDLAAQVEVALAEDMARVVARYPDRRFARRYERELAVVVDREKARFGAWYEIFPRSCASEPGRHGTFLDCEARLPYIAAMGFDVLYLPPVHPIGRAYRKGKNNTVDCGRGDPGSPWAIGAREGGHKTLHPRLGTLKDFRRLVARAKEHGVEIALDLGYQCSGDHPWLKEHPQWFRRRPDGSVQYAENPPKKYQDIYPLDFETDRREELWQELKSVVVFWIEQGVRIFRVDNPHTKPFCFWEWLIRGIKQEYPEVIFLSEAFTRPKVMYRLAKLGFSQSYTYFAWRNTAWEIEQYFTELTQTEVREYFRPNLWPNTPDILTEYLQLGKRPAFMARLVLAATLGASYGIYGPAFELCEDRPREAGSEEYLDSEKYEIKHWDTDAPASLKEFIARVNRIRRENPALHGDWSLRFHRVDNEELVCYSKSTDDQANVILVVVNLDPHHTQAGWTDLSLEPLGLDPGRPYQVHDLLGDGRYLWDGRRNYVELNPHVAPAHVFRIRRRLRTEHDFDYYM